MTYKILVENKNSDIPIFDSELLSLPVFMSGEINCRYPGAKGTVDGTMVYDNHTIEHNLGYVPTVYLYFKNPDGETVPSGAVLYNNPDCDVPPYGITITNYTPGDNSIVTSVYNWSQGIPLPKPGAFDYKIYYYIFKKNVLLDNDRRKNMDIYYMKEKS